jgi:hypothetical protein
MRKRFGTGTGAFLAPLAFLALGAVTAASGCDHIHWLGVLDGGSGSKGDGSGSTSDAPPQGDGGGDASAGCQAACGAIMGCGLGGYGAYHPGIGYARPYLIGPYGYATGYSSMTDYGYGAYGFRDLEYQQCVSSCETFSSCLGCGPPSERDAIVSCVLANVCPTLLDCLALDSTIR